MTQPKIGGVGHGKPVMPFGSDGTDWYAILVDALGHLQVDVVSAALESGGATETTLLLIKGYVDALETLLAGGLPAALDTGALKIKEQSPLTGFATSANQATMITALQLIDDLRGALGSVATDKVLVASKSGDKIFGFESVVADQVDATVSGADGYVASSAVTTGKIWVITTVVVREANRALTEIAFLTNHDGVLRDLYAETRAFVANERLLWGGHLYLDAGDTIRAYFKGAQAGDTGVIACHGYQMNAP